MATPEITEAMNFQCFAAAQQGGDLAATAESFVDVEEYENQVINVPKIDVMSGVRRLRVQPDCQLRPPRRGASRMAPIVGTLICQSFADGVRRPADQLSAQGG
jgi:hypothetical protein